MNPPKHAVVVSIDEKSQIQAFDRTQPGLPIKPGKCGTKVSVTRWPRVAMRRWPEQGRGSGSRGGVHRRG
jgi:hypothetical protein